MIDDELKGMALAALREAYRKDLQALVNQYHALAEGLLEPRQGLQLAEIHTFPDDSGTGDVYVNLYGDWPGWACRPSCGYRTMLEALVEDDRPDQLWLQGTLIFVRRDGEWVAP